MLHKNMKRLMLAALILTIGVSQVAAQDSAQDPAMSFAGEEIKLSLEEAVELTLTSSSGIQIAKINKMNNLAKTEEYYQNISALSQQDEQASQAGSWASSSSRTSKEMARMSAAFATAQSEKNYEAELNSLKRSAVKQYFDTLYARDTARIASENVSNQELILKNTNAKYKLGLIAKKDVLAAEVSLNQARVDLMNAQNAYAQAQMNFNLYFGFPVMQAVTLTDTLKVTEPELAALEEAIPLALAARNEIAGANYTFDLQKLNLKEVGNNYSMTSARYYSAQASLMNAEKAAMEAPATVEIDVRTKYMALEAAKAGADLGKLSMEKAKESYRLANLSYNAGKMTLADVQAAQIASFQSELSYAKNLLTYKLAILDYEQSMTVGTTRVSF